MTSWPLVIERVTASVPSSDAHASRASTSAVTRDVGMIVRPSSSRGSAVKTGSVSRQPASLRASSSHARANASQTPMQQSRHQTRRGSCQPRPRSHRQLDAPPGAAGGCDRPQAPGQRSLGRSVCHRARIARFQRGQRRPVPQPAACPAPPPRGKGVRSGRSSGQADGAATLAPVPGPAMVPARRRRRPSPMRPGPY